MSFRRSGQRYGQTPEPVTPYHKAAQVWDERIGSARVQARNWRLIAFSCLLLAAGAAAALVWQSAQSRITPYVVEVDTRGQVRAVGPAAVRYEPTDAQIAYHLAKFVRNVRALSIDPIVVRRNWLAAYDYATARAATVLNEHARETDPFGAIGKRTVAVKVISVVRASDDSFEVRWREETYRDGSLVRTDRYGGIFTVVIEPPRTEEALRKNPLGIYVHNFAWSRELNPGEDR